MSLCDIYVSSYILAKYEPLYVNSLTAPTYRDFKDFETPVLNWAIVVFFFLRCQKNLDSDFDSLSVSVVGGRFRLDGMRIVVSVSSKSSFLTYLCSFCLLTESQMSVF